MPHAMLPVTYVAILLELVEEQGGDNAGLLDDFGFNEAALMDIERRVSARQLWTLIDNALQITAQPALGLYYGQRLTLTSHGVLGYALMSCKNMQQVVDILMKYYHLLLDSATLVHEQDATWVHISFLIDEDKPGERAVNVEIFFASLLTSLKQLLHRDDFDVRITFSYPEPAYAYVYRQIFGHQIHFDASRSEICLPVEILSEKPQFANPAMLKIYQQQCESLLVKMDDDAGLQAQVKKHLLASGRPYLSLEQAAAHFNMSSRTFRRRLEGEKTSFQKILDALRQELAQTYLVGHALSVENVAELLGFSDVSNFRRAFIRWTGISPAAYQKQYLKQRRLDD